jgi:hypothetical protein
MSHVDRNLHRWIGRKSCGCAAQVIALQYEVEAHRRARPHLHGEGKHAVSKRTVGDRALHLFVSARSASDRGAVLLERGAVLLENEKRSVVLGGAVGSWNVEPALPATADVLSRLGVRCDCAEEEKEGQQAVTG